MTASIFLTVVADEVRRILRTPWVIVAVVMCCSGSWVAIWLGQHDFDEQRRVYVEQLQSRLQVQLHFPTRVTGRGSEPGLRVLRPPNPAAAVIQGDDRALPAAWEMTPAGAEALAPYATVGRRLEGGGTWDLEAIVRIFGGFLAMSVGLAGILGDRVRGWIPAIAASPLSPSQLSLARLTGGFLSLTLFSAAWWVIDGVILRLAATDPAISAGRFISLWFGVIAYLSVLHALGVICAWRLQGPFQAIVVAFGIWLLGGAFGPGMIGLITEVTRPLPTRAQFERLRHERYADDLLLADKTIAKLASADISADLPVTEQDRAVDLRLRKLDSQWQAQVMRARQVALDLDADWHTQQGRRQQFQQVVAWLSPGQLFRHSMLELADNGQGYSQAWEHAVSVYQADLDRTLFDDRPIVGLTVPVGNGFAHGQHRHDAPGYADLPTFEEPQRSWKTRLGSASRPLVELFGWLVISSAAAWWFGVQRLRAAGV